MYVHHYDAQRINARRISTKVILKYLTHSKKGSCECCQGMIIKISRL